MASQIDFPTPSARRRFELPALGRAMTRCECLGLSFEEFAARMDADGLAMEAAMAKTGCGGNCTACVPDLRRFLAARAASSI